MGDNNEYILSHNIRRFMVILGLPIIITEKYLGQGPATKRPNKKGQTINGIWALKGIIISQGGYLPFHEGLKSCHRILWIKISHHTDFGKTRPPTGPLQPGD